MQLVLSIRWMFGPMAASLDASFSVRSCNDPQVPDKLHIGECGELIVNQRIHIFQ